MKSRAFKSQASSSRAFSGQSSDVSAFGTTGAFGTSSSSISYLAEQPELSQLTDANLVVSFKNLQKRDSTTKAKALEDLQRHVVAQQEQSAYLDDQFLNAWIKVFPRASIDASRRVRQISQMINGKVAGLSGKRMVKHMLQIIPCWLMGLHDADKGVARAAGDAFAHVFPSYEKQYQVKKLYQNALLSFCFNLVNTETPSTLSDERNTTPEDSDAVYFRAISTVVSAVTDTIHFLDDSDLRKQQSYFEEITRSETLWDLISAKDASVRRSVAQLANALQSKLTDVLLPRIGLFARAFISKSAMKDQTASSVDYVQTLQAVTRTVPEIWTDPEMSKIKPEDRMGHLVRYGSHSGPSTYWDRLSGLFEVVPDSSLPSQLASAMQLLSALQKSLSRREEPQSNAARAYASYFVLLCRIISQLPQNDSRQVIKEMALPILRQYIEPSADTSHWSVPKTQELQVVSMALDIPDIHACLESGWATLGSALTEQIKTSSPEQSKNFELSQGAIESHAKRFFALEAEALKRPVSSSFHDLIDETRRTLVNECVATLEARAGKPYGACGCIIAALQQLDVPNKAAQSSMTPALDSFLRSGLSDIFFSPSQGRLIELLYESRVSDAFVSGWNAVVDGILAIPDGPVKLRAVEQLLCSPRFPTGFHGPKIRADLQAYLLLQIQQILKSGSYSDFLNRLGARSSKLLSQDTIDVLLSDMMNSLVIDHETHNALEGLKSLRQGDPDILRRFAATSHGGNLLPNLLRLQESMEDDETRVARDLSKDLVSSLSSNATQGSGTPGLSALREGLSRATPESLSIDTLADLALQLQDEMQEKNLSASLLPSRNIWLESLKPLLAVAPPQSFATMDLLGGMIYLIHSEGTASPVSFELDYDGDGFSPPLRMGMYITCLINRNAGHILDNLDEHTRVELCRCMALTAQMVNDKLSDSAANRIWASKLNAVDERLVAFVSESREALWTQLTAWSTFENDFQRLQQNLLAQATDVSSSSFHHARCFSFLASQAVDLRGSQLYSTSALENEAKKLRGSASSFAFAAYLSGFGVLLLETAGIRRLLNELIASLTGQETPTREDETLRDLSFVNLILLEWDAEAELMPKQRLVFFVKTLIKWLQSDQVHAPLKAEACKSLCHILPRLADLYGEQWSEVFKFLVESWSSNISAGAMSPLIVSLTHASLKLVSVLRSMTLADQVNDDLKDAWSDSVAALANGLLNMLEMLGSQSDETDQPLRMVNELLARQVAGLPVERLRDVKALYSLLATNSRSVQQATYQILHREVPKAQEQISLDAALEKSIAKLPDELLSLIATLPVLERSSSIDSERQIPGPLFTYLSSWLLIFDHFRMASDKVKRDYIAQIKEGGYLIDLLDFICTFLGHAKGRPIDASKFDATAYSFNIEQSPTKDVQWLLIHLYYLSLKRMPSLTKVWWIDCKSRQIRTLVEPWTEKYFSPTVIGDVLTATRDWAATQDPSAEDALIIKTNLRTREVTASKEIDEQLLTMAIRLPTNFPLGQVLVEGVNRVAVDEKRWRSWLLNTQGVITFSDNSIAEGLIAFRRNVVGQLKGQTECAICYSIVAQDKQLPTKKCGTCNNLFHGSCLYRWFKSSNSSSCPLCRTSFNYA